MSNDIVQSKAAIEPLFCAIKMLSDFKKSYFCKQISNTMKKVLPLLLLALLALAGCQRGPATYEISESPREFVPHAEKFVNQVEKKSKHYSAEDWTVAVDQFIAMSKDYVDKSKYLTQEEQMKFDNARVKFMKAIYDNGTEEVAMEVKRIYAELMGN